MPDAAAVRAADICSKCGLLFIPATWKVENNKHICAPCYASHMREYRRKGDNLLKQALQSRAYRLKIGCAERSRRARQRVKTDPGHALKMRCRNTLSMAVRDGRVKREPCRVCGAGPSEAHHEDYAKPFEVIWLCLACHCEAHGKTYRGTLRAALRDVIGKP